MGVGGIYTTVHQIYLLFNNNQVYSISILYIQVLGEYCKTAAAYVVKNDICPSNQKKVIIKQKIYVSVMLEAKVS